MICISKNCPPSREMCTCPTSLREQTCSTSIWRGPWNDTTQWWVEARNTKWWKEDIEFIINKAGHSCPSFFFLFFFKAFFPLFSFFLLGLENVSDFLIQFSFHILPMCVRVCLCMSVHWCCINHSSFFPFCRKSDRSKELIWGEGGWCSDIGYRRVKVYLRWSEQHSEPPPCIPAPLWKWERNSTLILKTSTTLRLRLTS